jgi:hypothetical protein
MTESIITTLLVNAAVFSVLFRLFMLARLKLKKHLSPAAMLALWAVVVIKLVVPFGFEAGISLIPAVPESAYTAAGADDYTPGALTSNQRASRPGFII